jgi:hypothetical protein
MSKAQSIENLREAKQILDELDLPFFLCLGTALGAYRDHDFCEGDEGDIDLGLHKDYYIFAEDIKELFFKGGFVLRGQYEHPLNIAPELSFTRNDCHVDIFFFTPIEDMFAWTFYSEPPQVRMIDNFFEKFDDIEFFGMQFKVPSPIESYLEANYGDWKTPIASKDWSWAEDNECPILYQK